MESSSRSTILFMVWAVVCLGFAFDNSERKVPFNADNLVRVVAWPLVYPLRVWVVGQPFMDMRVVK